MIKDFYCVRRNYIKKTKKQDGWDVELHESCRWSFVDNSYKAKPTKYGLIQLIYFWTLFCGCEGTMKTIQSLTLVYRVA